MAEFDAQQAIIRQECVDSVSHRDEFMMQRFDVSEEGDDEGRFKAIVGNMGANKSAHLILEAELLRYQRIPHLVISRPEDRERYDDKDMSDVVSAVGIKASSVMVSDLTALNPTALVRHGVRAILLDEIQFNDLADVKLVLYEWALSHGIDVTVAGLRTAAPAPYSTRSLSDAPPWETMAWILLHAADIQICRAACFMCGIECDHTMKAEDGSAEGSEGVAAAQEAVVAVGSTEAQYNPVCARCYASRYYIQ